MHLGDGVIIEVRHNLAQIGVEAVLGVEHNRAGSSKVTRRLKTFLAAAEVPPTLAPLLRYSKSPAQLRFSAMFEPETKPPRSRLECSVALKFHTEPDPVIALNVFCQAGPHADCKTEASFSLVSRRSVQEVIRLLETLDARDTTPMLTVCRSQSRKFVPVSWNDLVLSPSIISLLKKRF